MTSDINQLLRQAEGLQAAGRSAQAEAAYKSILERAPDAIFAHLRLSELHEGMDRYREARESALAAATSLARTRRWEALPFVTLRLLAFDERDLVRRAIVGADWSQPAVIAQSPALSQHLWLCDAYEQSLELIRRASENIPPNPLLLYSRANALRYSGRLEEATVELERCIALAPNHAQAHWTLAFHQKSPRPGARVERIRRAKDALPANDPGQVFLDYALFKEFDDAGDTTAAWVALERGMRAKRASLRYDARAQAGNIAALARNATAVAPPEGAAPAQGTSPLFVVGLPRTGTTLLERILSNHADVSAGGELGDFQQALDWQLDGFAGSPPAASVQPAITRIDAEAIGMRYLQRTAGLAKGRRYLTDKNPSNLFHAATIARALPRARVLCLVRDPMDACFSNLKELFTGAAYGYSYDFAEMAAQQRSFAALVADWERLLPGRFIVVRYEELATDPERVAAQVAAACGLRAQAGLADSSGNAAPVLTASSTQVRQPVHAGNIGAWRRYESQLAPLREMLEAR